MSDTLEEIKNMKPLDKLVRKYMWGHHVNGTWFFHGEPEIDDAFQELSDLRQFKSAYYSLEQDNNKLRDEVRDLHNELDKYDDRVSISQEKYVSFLDAQEFLNALREFGVDNWSGYSDAVESLG